MGSCSYSQTKVGKAGKRGFPHAEECGVCHEAIPARNWSAGRAPEALFRAPGWYSAPYRDAYAAGAFDPDPAIDGRNRWKWRHWQKEGLREESFGVA